MDHYFIRRYILFSSLMNLHKRVYITLRSEGGEAEDRIQKSEVRRQKAESSTTLSFPQVFSGNPEDVMVPR